MTRVEITEQIVESMRARDIGFDQIAGKLSRPKVWTAAALLGQHPFDALLVVSSYRAPPRAM